MTRRGQLSLVVVVVIAAQGLVGCGSEAVRSSVPSAPSPTSPPSVATGRQPSPWPPGVFTANITLTGVVFERVQDSEVPIEGAWVYCELCTEETHAGMYTDNKGSYTFKGVWDNNLPISVSKQGYQDPRGTGLPDGYARREVTIKGDTTQFNVELARK